MLLEVVRSAKERLFKDVFLSYSREYKKYTYLHEILQCPQKAEFEREEPEAQLTLADSNEVVDGFLTEEFIARFSQVPVKTNELVVSKRQVNGKPLAFHVDLTGEGWGAEVKTPVYLFVKKDYPLPEEKEFFVGPIPEHYELQARMQAFLLSEVRPLKEFWLLIKTTTKARAENGRVRMKKVWILKEVSPLSKEEFLSHLSRWERAKEEGAPLMEWECKYCLWKDKCKERGK